MTNKHFHPVLSFFFVYALMGSVSAYAGQNVLYYYSEPGDWIGAGNEITYTGSDGTFSLSRSYANSLNLTFITPGHTHWWYLNLAPTAGATLQPGAYENAERFPFQSVGHPGLNFSGDGRGCNTLTGRYDILELVSDAQGNIQQFAANWQQHCEGGEPALYGQIRYNSDVPLSGKPIHITLENSLNRQRCVEATDANGALVILNALDITDAQGGNSLNYNWTTSTGEQATGSTFSFNAPLTQNLANPIVATLTVTDLTNNAQKSVTKSICVSDTTPPVIVINRPRPGEIVKGGNLLLDVSIKDSVDNNITKYNIQVGSNFVSPLNPQTGQSRQQIIKAPKADGTITTTITVRANDASGNYGEKSVTVSEIPANRR